MKYLLPVILLLATGCQNADVSRFGENSLVCFEAQGASLFSVFSGYAETRVVHIPQRLQEAMNIDQVQQFAESCWLEGNEAAMLEMVRASQ